MFLINSYSWSLSIILRFYTELSRQIIHGRIVLVEHRKKFRWEFFNNLIFQLLFSF